MIKGKQKTHRPRLPKSLDEKFMGMEPDPVDFKLKSAVDLIQAYNWYNYFHSSEDAKRWTIGANTHPEIKHVPDFELRTIGWTYRLIKRGFELPEGTLENAERKLSELIDKYRAEKQLEKEAKIALAANENKLSIQDRIKLKASAMLNELESLVDDNTLGKLDGEKFDVYQWLVKQEASHFHARIIKDYYEKWEEAKKDRFLKKILEACDAVIGNSKAVRKKRKPKSKTAAQILKDFRFKERDIELKLESLPPSSIIGAKEVWLYNCEKRILTVLRGELTVKGTTVIGWDEKNSATKKIRKPKEVLTALNGAANKTAMKKIFESLNVKPMLLHGRTNPEMIILRAFK